jgi:hypothetical protein
MNKPGSSETKGQTDGVTIGDVEGGIRDTVTAGHDVTIGQRITNFFLGSTEQQRAQRNRQAMLKLVKDFWVKGVLEKSLHGAAMIELGLEERPDAVENPWDMVLQTEEERRSLPSGTRIIGVFDEMGGSLLILGEPGSGKTTMLLELARDTIARAEQDPTQPIPVVFNLSSWAEKRQPIADWLVEELNTRYNVPKRVARRWVENDDLLLLLDGLDEIKPECREACVKAINDFRQEHGLTPIVACSRVADYEALTYRLKLQGAVLLQPFTPQQIDEYFGSAGTGLLIARELLEHDPALQELARTPLMLSIITLTHQGMSVEDLQPLDSVEKRRGHVLNAYVRHMLGRRGKSGQYSSEQTICRLTWLAQRMLLHSQTVFLIYGMQPSWLQTQAQKRLYVVTVGLITGLIAGLSAGLFVSLMFVLFGGAFGVFSTAVIVGLFVWLAGMFGGSCVGLVVGLLLGVIVGVISGMVLAPGDALKSVLIVEVGFVLFGGLLGSLTGLIRRKTLLEEPILFSWETTRSSLILVLILDLVLVLLGGLRKLTGMADWLIGELIGMAGCGVSLLLLACFTAIRHLAMRFIFCGNGYLPWNYARFLDYATERIFLRKVGGGYIFVHRILQDYFASLYKER